jgi:hypothetical protein
MSGTSHFAKNRSPSSRFRESMTDLPSTAAYSLFAIDNTSALQSLPRPLPARLSSRSHSQTLPHKEEAKHPDSSMRRLARPRHPDQINRSPSRARLEDSCFSFLLQPFLLSPNRSTVMPARHQPCRRRSWTCVENAVIIASGDQYGTHSFRTLY